MVVSGPALGGAGPNWGTISVSPGSQSTCTKNCRIGRGAQLGAIGPIGLRPALYGVFTRSMPQLIPVLYTVLLISRQGSCLRRGRFLRRGRGLHTFSFADL